MQPFQLQITDERDNVLVIVEVDQVELSDPADDDDLSDAYMGRVVRETMSEDLKSVLRKYHEAWQGPSLGYIDRVQNELLAFNLRVAGIPGQERSVPLADFQLEPNGAFLLRIEVQQENKP